MAAFRPSEWCPPSNVGGKCKVAGKAQSITVEVLSLGKAESHDAGDTGSLSTLVTSRVPRVHARVGSKCKEASAEVSGSQTGEGEILGQEHTERLNKLGTHAGDEPGQERAEEALS